MGAHSIHDYVAVGTIVPALNFNRGSNDERGKKRDSSLYLSGNVSGIRPQGAERARANCAQIRGRCIGQITRRDLYEWGVHDRWITLVQERVQSVCSKRGHRCAHGAAEPTVWSRQICAADAAARGSAGHAQHRNGGALGCDFGDDRNARRLAYHIDFTPTLLSPISATLIRAEVRSRVGRSAMCLSCSGGMRSSPTSAMPSEGRIDCKSRRR